MLKHSTETQESLLANLSTNLTENEVTKAVLLGVMGGLEISVNAGDKPVKPSVFLSAIRETFRAFGVAV